LSGWTGQRIGFLVLKLQMQQQIITVLEELKGQNLAFIFFSIRINLLTNLFLSVHWTEPAFFRFECTGNYRVECLSEGTNEIGCLPDNEID